MPSQFPEWIQKTHPEARACRRRIRNQHGGTRYPPRFRVKRPYDAGLHLQDAHLTLRVCAPDQRWLQLVAFQSGLLRTEEQP